MRYTLLSLCLSLALMLCLFTCLPACATAADDYGTAVCMEDALASAGESGKPKILYTAITSVSLNKRS